MVHQGHEGLLQLGPELQHELVVGVDGEGRRHEAHVQRAAEGHEHVDRPLVVQPHDGVHALGKLGTDWDRRRVEEKEGEHLVKTKKKVLEVKGGSLVAHLVNPSPPSPYKSLKIDYERRLTSVSSPPNA